MVEKKPLKEGNVQVTFRISRHIWANCIAVVGEFNGWDPQSHALRQSPGDGEWRISLELEANRSYCFRYLVDGQEWMDDDHADAYLPNADGGFDSVVRT